MDSKLILMRHGQSEWNLENRFTGWHDSPLTEQGKTEATIGAKLLLESQLIPSVVHTSVLSRAIQTTEIVLTEIADSKIPVKKSWRLNERHYGDLTGKNKNQAVQEFGKEQVFSWRRKYSIRPPEITDENEFAAGIISGLASSNLDISPPKTECLKDVLERILPYFEESIKPDLSRFPVVLISAHGNSLRALIKHLDNISEEEISTLNIPTAIPLVYKLDSDFTPIDNLDVSERYLGDVEAAKLEAEKIASQTDLTN